MNSNHKLKPWHWIFLLFLIAGTIFVSHQEHPSKAPYQQDEGMIFGTVFHAKYQYDRDLNAEIVAELNKVDASLSMFNPKSNISLINSNKSMKADSLMQIVFTLSQSISEATDGAFDVTVAPLVNAWGFGFKEGQFPDSTMIDSLLQFVGWQKVQLTEGEIKKQDSRTIMDFSAVAKGFGVDQVASLFRRHGITNFMIEIGGEVVAQGQNNQGEAWRIGINKPDDDSTNTNHELQDVLSLSGNALATSGNYRRFYVKDGRKIAHTIDPKTGFPAQHSILSSTVMAPSCAMADGYATSFMVMGLDKAKEFLKKHPQLDAYFIYSDEKGNYQYWCTSKLKGLIVKE